MKLLLGKESNLNNMEKYYLTLRPRANDNYPMHKEGCPFLPDENKRIYLGKFISDWDADIAGKRYSSNICRCPFCSKETDSAEMKSFSITSNKLDKDRISDSLINPMLKFLN